MIETWSLDYESRFPEKSKGWHVHSRNNIYYYYFEGKIWITSDLLERFNINSIIDYGCGNANSMRNVKDKPIFRYDPFVEKFKDRPTEPADLVVAYNVLSVIELDYVKNTLTDIFSLANKMVIFCVPIMSKENSRKAGWYLRKLLPFDEEFGFECISADVIELEKFKQMTRLGLQNTTCDSFLFVYMQKKQGA